MQSPFSFIVRPVNGKRYDNERKIGDIDFVISVSKEDHKTSNEIKDSLNVASITDVGTGVSKFFYTNNMAGSEYAALSGMSSGVYNGACNMPSSNGGDDGWTMATTYWHHSTRGNGTTMTLADCERVVSGILGDLA